MEIEETIQESIHPLFDKFEAYTKTSTELLRLKSVSKTGDIISIMAFQALAFVFVTLFVMVGSFALALYLGSLLGETYYGFLIVAGFYAVVCMVLYAFKSGIKSMIKKTFVVHYLN
ncbi:MAG: phage holin family protein [Bacteroidota bacterium]